MGRLEVSGVIVAVCFALTAQAPGQLRWEATGVQLGTARTHPGVAIGSDGTIYAIGGEGTNPKHSLKTAEKWCEGDPSWQAIASMSVERHLVTGVADSSGKIWAVGGHSHASGTVWDSVEIYNPALDQWETTGGSLNRVRCHHGIAITDDDRIFIFGGRDASEATNTVEMYEPTGGTWTYISSLQEARIAPGFAMDSQGRIYAIGGSTYLEGSGTSLSVVERYDPGDPNLGWQRVADLPVPVSAGAAFECGGEIWLVGGNSDACYIYSPDGDTWRSGPLMYESVSLAAAIVGLSGTPYLIGGERGPSVATAEVDRLVPEPTTLALLALGGVALIRRRGMVRMCWVLPVAAILLGPGMISFAAPMPSITDGLVAYYPLDGDYLDAWAGHHATGTYGTSFTADRTGQADSACLFDAFEQRISIPNDVLDGLDDFSVFMRVKVGSVNVIAALVSGANATHDNEALFQYHPVNGLGVSVHDITDWSHVTFPLGQWVSVAWARDGSTGTSDLYVITEGATNAVPVTIPDSSGRLGIDPNGLWLGQDQDTVGGSWQEQDQFFGVMDDVCFYDRALPGEEVWELHIPEPATLSLLALGGVALLRGRRRFGG